MFISANLNWLFIIVLGTLRMLSESTNYYEYLSRGDYSSEADSISIPIFQKTFFAFLILSILLIFKNIFILLTTRKINIPIKLFIKADFFYHTSSFMGIVFRILSCNFLIFLLLLVLYRILHGGFNKFISFIYNIEFTCRAN